MAPRALTETSDQDFFSGTVQKVNSLSQRVQQWPRSFTNALAWDAFTFNSVQDYTIEVTRSENKEIASALGDFLGEYLYCWPDVLLLKATRSGLGWAWNQHRKLPTPDSRRNTTSMYCWNPLRQGVREHSRCWAWSILPRRKSPYLPGAFELHRRKESETRWSRQHAYAHL